MRVLVVVGTRPEEIKLYPFSKYNIFDFVWVNQSKDLRQGLINFDWMIEEDLLEKFIRESPHEYIMVQGDTRTAFRGALYGFEQGREVIHIEAGLRTFDLKCPFPEEGYRQMIDCIASHRFCSRPEAVENCDGVYVGQTSIDTLFEFIPECTSEGYTLVTVHRNEADMDMVISLLQSIEAEGSTKLRIFAHPNKQGDTLRKHFKCEDPLPYREFVKVLAGADQIITDSGGLQEEAIALDKPYILLREKSERFAHDEYRPGATRKIVEYLKRRMI